MNRRQFLSGVGVAVAGTAGYGGARVADIRPYDPALPTGDSPRERIVAAARHRHVADHRAITRTRVLDDWTGEAPYDLDVFRQWYQHSRRRCLHALTTYAAPIGLADRFDGSTDIRDLGEVVPYQNLWAVFHYGRVFRDIERLPLTNVNYVTDGRVVYDHDAPTPEGGTIQVSDAGALTAAPDDTVEPARVEFVRPHRTDWTETERSAETVTYCVSGPEAYAQVVPLQSSRRTDVGDSRIEVTLARDTGRLRRIVDHRTLVIRLRDAADQSLTYRIETNFDQYGAATARQPAGAVEQSLDARLRGVVFDLLNY